MALDGSVADDDENLDEVVVDTNKSDVCVVGVKQLLVRKQKEVNIV
jgi:hypothetical protein